MAHSAEQALRVLDIRGCGARLKGGQLTARMFAGGPIPDDLVCIIKNNKPKLLAYLAEQERLAISDRKVLSLDVADFEEWRLEVLAAPEDDPHKAHDIEALQRALAAKRITAMVGELEDVA